MICSTFMANEYSCFEHRSTCNRYCGNIVSGSKKSGISKRMDRQNMTLMPDDYLLCRHSVQYFLACYKEKNQLTGQPPQLP